MGRRKLPLAHHEATGATAKNPARFRDRAEEPRPTSPLGDPPAEFLNTKSPTSLSYLGIWHELESQMLPGVATGCDRFIFEATCRLMYRCRRPDASTGDFAQLKACLAELGLTPAGRTRVAQRKAKEADSRSPEGWAALAEERASTAPVQ